MDKNNKIFKSMFLFAAYPARKNLLGTESIHLNVALCLDGDQDVAGGAVARRWTHLQDLLDAAKPGDAVLLEHLCGAFPHQQRQQTQAFKPGKTEVSGDTGEVARLQRKPFTALLLSLGRVRPDSRSTAASHSRDTRGLGVRHGQQGKQQTESGLRDSQKLPQVGFNASELMKRIKLSTLGVEKPPGSMGW